MTLQIQKCLQRYNVIGAIVLFNLVIQRTLALTVDNQLVSARNDCFERIALEAMLPFDKTFRTEDTNSLKSCKEKCLQAGEKCQSMSFGVHRSGNGTCQLSEEKYSSTSGRPKGIIFDPDFDLYARKTNCFDLSDNTIPLADTGSDFGGTVNGGSSGSAGDGYGNILPTIPAETPTVLLPNRPDEQTPVLLVNPTPSTTTTTAINGRPMMPTNGYGSTTTTQILPIETGTTHGDHGNDGDRLYFSHDIYPLYHYPTLYEQNYPAPNDDFYIPGGYASNVPSIDVNRYRPIYGMDEHVRPTPNGPPRPIFGLGYGNGYSYGKPERFHPTTMRPYDQDRDRDRPYSYAPRPDLYPNDARPDERPNYDMAASTYNSSPPPTPARPSDLDPNRMPTRPHSYAPRPDSYPNDARPDQRPNYDTTASNYNSPSSPTSARPSDFDPNRMPTSPHSYAPRPNSYSNDARPDQRPNYDTTASNYNSPSSPTPARPSDYDPTRMPTRQPVRLPYDQRPSDLDRPDPPTSNGYGADSSMRPPMRDTNSGRPGSGYGSDASNANRYDFARRNGSVAGGGGSGGGGGGYNDDKSINTYFNPEDYMPDRPGGYAERDRVGYPMDEMKGQIGFNDLTTQALGTRDPGVHSSSTIIIVEDAKACFRRVLAGKRVSPQWVRRTIACERVEECMRECGHEKRFMCEGFNYRLDPSGHGQGDCELIEVPLAQMDLYSSPHRRDTNLLRHPDYDYYERDRNAPSSCRKNMCQECRVTASVPLYFNPSSSGWGSSDKPYQEEHYLPAPPIGSGSGYGSSSHDSDHYRYPPPKSSHYDHRPTLPPLDYHHSGSYESYSSHDSSYFDHIPPSSYGSSGSTASGAIDRYDDLIRPDDHHRYRPPSHHNRWETLSSSSGYDSGSTYHDYDSGSKYQAYDSGSKYQTSHERDRFRPPYLPGPNYSPYRPHELDKPKGSSYHSRLPPAPPPSNYLDRDRDEPPPKSYKKPSKFVPYLIGAEEENWGSYGGSYGGSYNKQSSYWGLKEHNRRKDAFDFNYFELGSNRHDPPRETNSVLNYPGSKYGADDFRDRHDYRHQWTRRPGPDECSAKTSEGFRLHKTAVRHSYNVPTLTECERLCSGQDGFICQTFSYRYTPAGRDNCMLCDRPVNRLDYYVDIEPDRDYDIYSMTDDLDVCRKPALSDGPPPRGSFSSTALADPRNMQCFFRALDATRFFKSIVRDSLTVRSVGECEMECIKSSKFTCRAFAFRYGQQRHASVIDNCQLSDWPVRDMHKDRHLIQDATFDVFERASYGHGCELQPIMDQKHKKFCYLGYGSPAKLLPAAIKKVISVHSESDCKKECIRFRETTSFKCYSFSYGSHARSYNCEMSDLDQTELKLDVHYTNTKDRDYWLFAWNPFDWTCRDKVNTIGGGTRINNDRRMDIFREPGDLTWRHYTVSGKACRRSSPCEKNIVTGFYSCEIDGGEIGSWDYCCKTEHPCGYSHGFDYPWCFVGDEPDQWRKCSDRYFPGNHTQTHSGLTVKSDKKKQTPPKSVSAYSDEFQHPPRPGGLQSLSDFAAARLWPVTYLYSEGPPNATEFSNFVDCNKESC